MSRKKERKINKIVLGIAICMICIPKTVFGATIDLSKDKEMEAIVMELCQWEQDYGYEHGSNPTSGEIAKKIIEVCGGDETKIEKLQNSYSSGGITYWHGDNPNSSHYTATNSAITSNKNNTEIKDGNDDEARKLSEEIASIATTIKLYNGNPSVEDLKKLDAKLKEYNSKFGNLPESLLNIAQKTKEKLEGQGENGETAADEVKDRLDEREEYNKGGTTTVTNPNRGTVGGTLVDPITNPEEYKPSENLRENNTQLIERGNLVIGVIQLLGSAISVITLMTLGIRYMLAGVQEKALYKETMGPYLIGAVMVFAIPNIIAVLYDFITGNLNVI